MMKRLLRLIKRIKLAFKCFKHYYSFDIVDTCTEILFNIFLDFYESQKDSLVEFEAASKDIKKIYFYLKVLRPKWEKKRDDILLKWDSSYTLTPIDDKSYSFDFINKTKQNEKYITTHDRLELFIKDKDTEYAKKIIEIRQYLWN